MTRYTINQDINDSHNARRVLIGTPLMLALLFSFGFMTMRPGNPDTTTKSAATHPAAAKTTNETATSNSFTPIALAETTLPTISEAPVADASDASVGSASSVGSATSPQATSKAASSTGSTTPQSATASGQSVNPKQPLNIRVGLPNSLLTNLLR